MIKKGRYGIYRRKPIYKENSEQAYRLYSICRSESEREIAKLLFIDGCSADETAEIVYYSARQIYRIKKKLKERLQNMGNVSLINGHIDEPK